MGVPSFYRWLVNKYPKIVVKAIEEKEDKIETSLVNPNGMEYDNLYLDMNGIIHPCFHPDDHPSPPKTFQEVFNNIYEYIDRLFSIVRPRKLLSMAIDGVAPRAKMNQQRTRRFRTAKDNEIAEAEENRFRKEFEMEGKQVLPKQESEVSDSNIITPGTVFMHELSIALQAYINQRLKDNVGWKGIKVILSDANVPGEGEHKIMSFIRLQRTCPDYDPNTHHCLYGLDADLIMLALATHELHFSILREDVLIQEQQPASELVLETSLRQAEFGLPRSRGWFQQRHQSIGGKSSLIKKPYQFLHVWVLREYIELDLKISDPPQNIKIDLERIIDDFIFMCIFTGNDFLPHMPTLSIHEGAIDLLMHVYKDEFKNLGGYLVDMQWVGDKKARYIKLKRVEKFILLVGAYEERIFKKRSELRDRKLRQLLSEASEIREEQEENLGFDLEVNGRSIHGAANGKSPISKNLGIKSVGNSASSIGAVNSTCDILEILQNTKELKEKLKKYIRDKSDLFKTGSFVVDKVRLGSIGWKERYYKEKFCTESKEDMESMRKTMVHKYTEGLCWVLQYYFSGVPSWTWFYPYHYSPFASDFRGLSQVKVIFQKGSPFKPFYQLMGVLPPRSAHALPRAYRALMTSEESEIIDFYPTDFEFDEDGKRFMWQAVCKLPFIDEERLLSQMKKLVAELGVDEELRNLTKVDYLFVRSSHVLRSQTFSLHEKQCEGKQTEMVKELIDKNFKCGISGFISPREDNDSRNDNVLCVLYELPNGCQHIPRPLEGVQPPEKTIYDADIMETQLWHEYQGSRPNYRAQIHGFHRSAQIQGFHRNAINGAKSSPELIHKGAGSGWGAGRGKPNNNIYHGSSEHTGSSINFPVGRGERLDHDIRDLRISDSRQGFKSYGRAQSVDTNLWPSRNSPMSAPPCGQGLTANTSHTGQRNQSPVANPSMQAHGRGLYIPVWQQNQSPVASPSMQAHGRGRYIPVWRQNQSPVASPSMQAHGRAQYIPNPWNLRDTRTSSTERCVLYELPNGCQHIPRPLEGVQPPEKTIYDADIMETQLWHEYQGSRPNYRAQIHEFHRSAQIQGFHRNAINGAKSSPELIHKGAGSGWGAGRGKPNNNIYHGSSEHTGSSINFPVGHGKRLDHDIGDLRISDSRQGFKSYGRAQSVDTNLWPSRNSPMFAPPCGQGLTVNTSHTWQRNQFPVANPSMQAHGRGLYIPVWQQNQSPVASPSMQAHGRGRYIPVWRQNQSPVASPSMQAHGRAQYIPNPWNLRDTRTSSTERYSSR